MDLFTNPENVPLSQWLIAGGTLVVALFTLLAFFRRRTGGGVSVTASDRSIAAGKDVVIGGNQQEAGSRGRPAE